MNLLKRLSFLFLFVFIWSFQVYAATGDIDITVSPIRYEMEIERWSSGTWAIKVINNSDYDVFLTIEKEDCNTKDSTGTPSCFPASKNPNLSRVLSPYITTSTGQISIPSHGETDIGFTLNIPEDATPWGRYGAIFFNYLEGNEVGSLVKSIKRIGVLILLNIPWEVEVIGEVSDVNIRDSRDGGWWANPKQDSDLAKKIKDFIISELISPEKPKELTKNDDKIDFSITFENEWNTHIKLDGKIVILDENGNVIKNIGKEIIRNNDGVQVGEKIVDYLPINDTGKNILPDSEIVFDIDLEGFPYEVINDEGKQEIRYKDFWEYYTEENFWERKVLMFWEMIKTEKKRKKLTAQIEMHYKDEDEEDIVFNSAEDFYVVYEEQYIGINWRVIFLAWSLLVIFLLIYFLLLGRRKRKEKSLEEKIRAKILKEEEKKKKKKK